MTDRIVRDRYCCCPADGTEGEPCGRPLHANGGPIPKHCVGCQIARCDSASRRTGKGAADCPARVRGPVVREG